jgi:type I restriction enzyme S subunit
MVTDTTIKKGLPDETSVKAGYKQTEIGVIPEDWDVKEMEDFTISVASGKSNTTNELGDYPIYGSTGIIGYKKQSDYAGDKVLIARVGANAGTVNEVSGKYCVSDNTLMVTYQSGIDINFSYYQLINFKLNKLIFGSGQPLVTGSQIKKIAFALPKNKSEQTVIATVLSDTDALIECLGKLIAKKKAIKQGAMQELLTGKKRLPGFSGEWKVKELGDLLYYEQPTKYLVKDTEYNDNNDTPVLTAGKTFILGFTNEEFGIFNNIPVIIFDDFTTANKFVTFPFKAKSSAMKILIPTGEDVNLRFVYEKMQLIDFPLGDHKRYWISEYQNLKIGIPKPEEQTAIATILSDMDTEIESLEQKRNKYTMLKQGMMQQLLTGRIRIYANN